MSDYDLKAAPRLPARGSSARIWVISDIQQSAPSDALATLSAAVDDILATGLELDGVWCLGDALRGAEEPALEEVADIFIRQLARLNLPVCYLLGNHDVDLKRVSDVDRHPLWERARAEPNWHVAERLDDFFFARRIGNCLAVFMGDHAHSGGEWFTTHGGVSGRARERYPHDEASYARLSQALADFGGPVILASHYALPGGQKPSALMTRLLPLPANVKLFMHGHAHIGDLVWNKDNPWQRNNPVEGQPMRQFNVSALETVRSPGSHSAVVEIGADGPESLRIRCHQRREWLETFPLAGEASRA
ncbi:MAG: metallophosphoesterase [Rariglobus sp.]